MRGSVQSYPYALANQSVEPVGCSFVDMLPAGRTLASVNAWLIDPDGILETTIAANQIQVSSPLVTVTIGPFAKQGTYKLHVEGVCSGSAPPAIPKLHLEIEIQVRWDADG
jgi:hypothetical protein